MCSQDFSEFMDSEDDLETDSDVEIVKSEGRKFERKIEDFTCDNCDTFVEGDGYTDHCPCCLYSKHVDINPGDRGSSCHGSMKPMAAEVRKDDFKIHYECEKCGYEHKVRSSPDDDFELILGLIGKPY